MIKNRLKRIEKEIGCISLVSSISYRKLDNGKYVAVEVGSFPKSFTKEGWEKLMIYDFEGKEIDAIDLFDSVEEIKKRFGIDFEYNDYTKHYEHFCSQFEN